MSRGGLVAAGLFLVTFIAAFSWIFFIASKNPADSGESAIILLIFTMPWVNFVPQHMLGLPVAFACVLFNALILYLVFGGLRLSRRDK